MTKRQIIVYVSGPYSGTPSEITSNIKKSRQAAIFLWEKGYTALSPVLNTANFEIDCNIEYNDYMAGDIVLLGGCTAVFMVDGWERSAGATIEKETAEALGIPYFTTTDELDTWAEKYIEDLNK